MYLPKFLFGILAIFALVSCDAERPVSVDTDNSLLVAAKGPMLVIVDASGPPEYWEEQRVDMRDAIRGTGQNASHLPMVALAYAAHSCSRLVWIDSTMSEANWWIAMPAAASPFYEQRRPGSDAEIADCIKSNTGTRFLIGRVETAGDFPIFDFLSEEQLHAQKN